MVCHQLLGKTNAKEVDLTAEANEIGRYVMVLLFFSSQNIYSPSAGKL
jgi:hypothetical protein